jgi:hypothetical protein
MARRAVVDQEEVFQAAEALTAEGKQVTALALHGALGGGSLTTIYKHLAAWEASRPVVGKTSDGGIPDAVQSAFANTWRVAAMEAAREVSAAKEKAADEVKAAQKQFQDALEAIARLELEVEAEVDKVIRLEQQLSENQSAMLKASNDNAVLLATVEHLQRQVKSCESELERLHKETDAEAERHRHENQHLANEKDVAIKEAAELRGQLAAVKEQNAELLAKLTAKK